MRIQISIDEDIGWWSFYGAGQYARVALLWPQTMLIMYLDESLQPGPYAGTVKWEQMVMYSPAARDVSVPLLYEFTHARFFSSI